MHPNDDAIYNLFDLNGKYTKNKNANCTHELWFPVLTTSGPDLS